MKKAFIIVAILFLAQQSFAQLQIDWQNCFGGEKDDRVNDLVSTGDGFFVLGSYGIHVNHPIYNLQYDVWLIKTDLTGNILWEKKYGGSKNDFGINILDAGNGNFIIVAQTSSNDYDLVNTPFPNSANYWIYKINSYGDILWSSVVGGNGEDWPINATLLNDNSLIIIGKTTSEDGDVSSYYGGWDLWAIEIDTSGAKIWDYTFGTEGLEWGNIVFKDNQGSIFFGGCTTFEGLGNIDCEPYSDWGESLLIKFDSDLNLQWQQCYGGSLHENIFSISQSVNGLIIGQTTESNDGDVINSGFHGNVDIWLSEVDSLGNISWSKCYGGSQYEQPSISFSEDNGEFTVFSISNSHDGDVTGNQSAVPRNDIWVLRIDSVGSIRWQQCLGGIADELIGLGVKKDELNSYIIAAATSAIIPSGEVECTLPALSVNNLWFLKVTDTTVVSINEPGISSWRIYPNPAADYVTLEFDNQNSTWRSAVIYDCTGRMIFTQAISGNKIVLHLHDLPSGFYYASLTGQKVMTPFKKLVLIK